MRPGGTLIISTPDSKIYSPDGRPANKFHRRELTECEFLTLTKSYFCNVTLLRQRPLLGSVILSAAAGEGKVTTFDRRGDDTFETNSGLARALYLLAWCSDSTIDTPAASVYVETSQIEVRDAERNSELRRLEIELASQTETIRRLEELVAGYRAREVEHAKERQVQKIEQSMDEWLQIAVQRIEKGIREQINEALNSNAFMTPVAADEDASARDLSVARSEIERLSLRLHAIETSTSWRALYPLHRTLEGMPVVRTVLRTGARMLWRTSTRPFRRSSAAVPPMLESKTERTAEFVVSEVTIPIASNKLTEAVNPLTLTPVQRRVQIRAIGSLMPAQTLSVVVGIVTYNNDDALLRRLIGSAQKAIKKAGGKGAILFIDNGKPSLVDANITKIASEGNIGFGAAHNRLMTKAFETLGADIYIAANPDGAFHPDCIDALVRMHASHGGQALVEACQFPVEHPKVYDAVTFQTEWASGACLSIPRVIYEDIGGFDEAFFMYCEDVDYSWRARANGYDVIINPSALFLHAVSNRENADKTWEMMLKSGHILARKWGNTEFAQWTAQRLKELAADPASSHVEEVPEEWRSVANFAHNFSFSPVRW